MPACRSALYALALVAWATNAQTIEAYSRAQRAQIETAMAQLMDRGASAPSRSPTKAPVSEMVPTTAAPSGSASGPINAQAMRRTEPDVRVNGVLFLPARPLTEVVVDGRPYLLQRGEKVPGVPWMVESIAADHVILASLDVAADERASPISSRHGASRHPAR